MIITINGDTPPNEMHHIAVALQRIAAENGYKVATEAPTYASQTQTIGEMSVTLNVDTTNATSAVESLADLINRTGVKVGDVPPVTYTIPGEGLMNADGTSVVGDVEITIPPVADTNLDVNGLPWDARIHAGSRERNTDGSWRVRRRPKGVEEAEWDATLARVTAELTELMAIPVSPGAVADAAAEEREIGDVHHTAHALTDAEVDAFVDIIEGGGTEPVVVVPPVTIAPPVVVPPVAAVAPPIIETFAQLMSWLTSRTPKDEAAKPAMVAKVNEILAANGLTTLQQLGQRADLIPQVLVQFREAFGE